MQSYQNPYLLRGPHGNNAFALEQRGEDANLYVPGLREGNLEDLQIGEEIVFSDLDENGVLQACVGLKEFLRTTWEGLSLIVMDNHNHAFYFWWEAAFKGSFQSPATLIHVDQHRDMRVPSELFHGNTLEEAYEYTQKGLNVGNYIVPAREAGVVSDILQVTSQAALEELPAQIDARPLILNLDLDFFAPELSYISFELARDKIRAWAQQASLITVATSPFFIDQKRALEYLRRIFG